jgi:hypothetical protein
MLRCCDELGKTLQPRLILDCALIDVATIEPLVPLGDLIDRLTELEGRVGRPARAGGGGGGTKDRPRSSAPAPSPAGTRPPAAPSRGAAPVASGSHDGPADPVSSTQPPRPAPPSRGVAEAMPAMPGTRTEATVSGTRAESSVPGARAEVVAAVSERSAPVSMQPSGPVPRPETVAAGSGPHDDAPLQIAIPTSDGEALRAWNSVLHELETRGKVSLFGPFQHARVMKWTAEQLELGFPVDAESMGDMARDKADELCAIVRTLGPQLHAIKVVVRLLDASESSTTVARSIVEAHRERSTAERSRREAEAREHPITKHVLQTFGAQIKEIKTDV